MLSLYVPVKSGYLERVNILVYFIYSAVGK